jgi:polyether ionophore transport system ATP-binding protein
VRRGGEKQWAHRASQQPHTFGGRGPLRQGTIIRDGRAVESGTLSELRHLTSTSVSAELAKPPEGLELLPGVHGVRVDGNRVRCQVDSTGLDGLLRQLTTFGLRSLTSQPPTLEDLFLRHYEAEGQGAKQTGRTEMAR